MTAPILLSPRHSVILTYSWTVIFLIVLFDAAWLHAADIRFFPSTLYLILGVGAMLTAVTAFYRRFRRDDALWLGAQIANQLIIGSCALATLSYIVVGFGYPVQDEAFLRLDNALGFDWLAYVGFVDSHPRIAQMLTFSYRMTGPEVVGLLLLLCLFRRFAACHRFALGFLIGALITVVISGFVPAMTEYLHRHIAPAAYPNLQVADAGAYADEFLAARSHRLHDLPEVLQGIIAFPSFHSVIGVLAMFAARAIRWRILRMAIIALNVLMLLSTPVDGGHYLVDTLSGILLAVVIGVLLMHLLPDENQPAKER